MQRFLELCEEFTSPRFRVDLSKSCGFSGASLPAKHDFIFTKDC